MKERKTWTGEEDRVLKYLYEQRGMSKWSQIAEIMQTEFSLAGRKGKQCRERYHNHLDGNINYEEWSLEEENKLFQMQDQLGNKWAQIASKLPGRTDNCVKNHFYSKLRKSVRKLNKKIHKHLKRQFKEIKTSTLYKMLESMENRSKASTSVSHQTVQLCKKIKKQLRQYEDCSNSFQDQNEQLNHIRLIIEDIALFDKDIKKGLKKGSVRLNSIIEEEINSPVSKSNQISTKSVYDDEEESEYSNSDLFSSSSLDHRSLYSNRSQRLIKPEKNHCKSQNVQSQSEEESGSAKGQILYKSAKELVELRKQLMSLSTLSNSLKLPTFQDNLVVENQQSKSSSSSKSKSNGSKSEQNEKQVFYTYMMGEEPFEMRLLSPKKLTIQEKIELNNKEQDQLFYGEKMEIQCDNLVKNFQGLDLGEIPKLGYQIDL